MQLGPNMKGKKTPKKKPVGMAGQFSGAVFMLMALVALYLVVAQNTSEPTIIPVSELAQNVSAGTVTEILVDGEKLTATYAVGS